MQAVSEQLVYVESEDGYYLEGVVIRPAEGTAKPLPIVWTHGFTGRFYEPHAVRIGRLLAERGHVFVAGNNRGHNFGTILDPVRGEGKLAGAAWELIDESPRDVAAWIAFAAGLGSGQVALVGHSLGALKVAYYMSQRQDPRVRGLTLASGAIRTRQSEPELAQLAARLVDEGRGHELLPWGSRPGPAGAISAQTHLSRARAAFDPADFRCPILAFLGTKEAWIGSADDLDQFRRKATGAPRVDTHLIEGADHVYTGVEPAVAATIGEWVDSLG